MVRSGVYNRKDSLLSEELIYALVSSLSPTMTESVASDYEISTLVHENSKNMSCSLECIVVSRFRGSHTK